MIGGGKLLDADLLVSVTGETANASIDRILATPDGRFVAIQTQASNLLAGADLDTNDCADIYLVDRVRGAITRVSIANGLEAAADAQLGPLISAQWTLPTALSLITWYVFAPMCISTLAAMRRETGSLRFMLSAAALLFASRFAKKE